MIPLWFHALTRKFLSGRELQPMSRRARRLGSRLRVEALEDRTVTSIVNVLTPEPLAAVIVADVSYDAVETISRDLASALNAGGNPSVFHGPALERLLQDIQKIETHPATIRLRVTLPGSFGDTVHDQSFPSLLVSPVSGTTPHQAPSVSFTPSENPVTQPRSLPGDIAQPDKSIGQDTSNLTLQGGPAASPEVDGTATGPITRSLHNGSGGYDLTGQVHPSRIPDFTVARPPWNDCNSAGSETSETVSQSPASVEISALRTETGRLAADLPDASLLQRFVVAREQAAFTSLVQRYERLVLGICQRVLGDSHAAQDASQATFLVLARKASMLDGERPLAGWLYQVAYHLALRLRAVAARQRRCERRAADGRPSQDGSDPSVDIETQEMRQALLEELQRLPEKYRAPLVLCYFDGRTHDEAARAIGLPRGSMAKRIREALELLRERLLDRGFSL
jgi:RNA polymerase sigma factor (sigma-70 family)